MGQETPLLPLRADLRDVIRHYADLDIDSGRTLVTRAAPVQPQPFLQLTLEGRHVLRNVETGETYSPPRASLIGLCTRRTYNLEISGKLRMFSIHLQPAALNALTGLDMRPITDSCLKGSGGFWDHTDDLIEDLACAPDQAARIALADAWFADLAIPRPDPVALAARQLRDSYGRRAPRSAEHGLSERQFQRRFARQVGVTPKIYARICRVAAVVDMHEERPTYSWTSLAHANGFADQAHLTREFREIVGEAPTRFRRYRSGSWRAEARPRCGH